ncbi:MAG: N-acetylglucosamine-6-phosphate deacetylase [Dictyoglomaceae bacterium]
MERILILGKVITPQKIIENGAVGVEGNKIIYVGESKNQENFQRIIDFKNCYISPGFIDIHIHGAYGKDIIDGEESAIDTISRFIASKGTTSFLPTVLTAPLSDMEKAIDTVGKFMEKQEKEIKGAKVLGINLEGPFLNKKYKGAQREDSIISPNIEILKRLLTKNVKLITLAPEVEGNFEIIKYLNEKGVKISAGHTDAVSEDLEKAISLGLCHITHLFNGMRPLHHREPGIVGVALTNDKLSVEIIADGIHLSPYILKLVGRIKPKEKIILITDAMMATGLSDGEYKLAGQRVIVKDGKATLSDGTIAGSTLTLNTAVKNMVEKGGFKLEDAVFIASYSPSLLLEIENKKGSLEIGKDADITIFDDNFQVKMTMVEGRVVFESGNM